ncbi:MAG: penicillin-binding protein 2 [Rhodospirillales bacterium]|nr:penicillin-binding protein 2 [Rhodospirillales bacterium]
MARRNDDQTRYRIFTRRAMLIGAGQAALLSTLAGRMYYLQILESDRYATLAEDNRINLRLLAPPRGRIIDRFGLPLADNVQNYRVVLVREQTRDVAWTLDALGQIIELSDYDRERVLRETTSKRAFVPVTVRDNLTWPQVSRIEVNAPELTGVSIDVGRTRRYLFGDPMTPVLGYVSAVSESELTGDPLLELPDFRIGKNGVERQHDLKLRGAAGTSQIEVNAAGRVIRELKQRRNEAVPGKELVLTLDAELQLFVHEQLAAHESASAVVMNVENGEVLALGSAPSYDANAFSLGISPDYWGTLVNDPLSPLTNKAVAGLYAPGSTFKMMVALAALGAGASPGDLAFCRGWLELGNARFHCWKKHGHGWLDMIGGIKQSCDVYFYELSKRTGIDRISEMATRFGLGQPLGVDLPGERPGVVPTREWKLGAIGERWQKGETLVTAIGQGFILATPLQLAVMVARIASGRAVTPRVTRGFREVEGEGPVVGAEAPVFAPLDVPEAHLKLVRQAMDAVVNEKKGTAYWRRIAKEGWEMAGKTGTSQVRRITKAERDEGVKKNDELPWRFRDHALFVAFAPVHKPRYCCAVVVEHGGGGSKVAAPIARDILTEVQRRDPSAAQGLPLLASSQVREG